jgi:hypothetical protein
MLLRVVVSSSTTSSHRSSSWFSVAFVRGLRRSSTWFNSRVRTRSASRAADGPAGTVSTKSCLFLDTGSMPAYTLTRSAPLGSRSISPGVRLRPRDPIATVTD